MATLAVRLFGGMSLSIDDFTLPLPGSRQARSLLAYLFFFYPQICTRDRLIGVLWPDLPESTARRRLSQATWQIQSSWERGLSQFNPTQTINDVFPAHLIFHDSDTLRIDPRISVSVDVVEFGQLLSPGGHADLQAEDRTLRALDLYNGDLLDGYYDDWIILERERLHDVYLAALETRIRWCKLHQDIPTALLYTRRLVKADPWREEAHRELMRLLSLANQPQQALRQFSICRQLLQDNLGIEPSPETIALAQEIATQNSAGAPRSTLVVGQIDHAPLLRSPEYLPLVGRRAELATLLAQLDQAVKGCGSLLIIHGEAGIGKTHLLRSLAENATWRGIPVSWGHCYELAIPMAYQPLAEVLGASLPALNQSDLLPVWRAELSLLLPQLPVDQPAQPLPAEDARRRRLEAIAQGFEVLGRSGPRLILLEDAHWIDLASLEVLRYLLPRLETLPLLFLVTLRPEELSEQAALLLTALENTRLVRRLGLARFELPDTMLLIQHALTLAQPAPRFSARLQTETEGNPFFILETLRQLVDEGLLTQDAEGRWNTPWDDSTQDYAELNIPAAVAQSIRRRLDKLPKTLREYLGIAACIGRAVPHELWLIASGKSEQTLLAAAEGLCARSLLQITDSGYQFTHDLIRRVTCASLAPQRLRLYHRWIAEALAQDPTTRPEILAEHWTQAGEWEQAAAAHLQAGEQSRMSFANLEAIEHYSQALAALQHLPASPELSRIFALLWARESLYDLVGERQAQAQDLQALEQLANKLQDPHCIAQVTLRKAVYTMHTAGFPEARTMAQAAIQAAQAAGEVECEAASHILWGQILLRFRQFSEAQAQLKLAVSFAHAQGLNQQEAEGLRHLGTVYWVSSDYRAAEEHYQASLNLCQEISDQRGESAAMNNLGLVHWRQGNLQAARNFYQQALTVRRQIGDRQGEGSVQANLGILQRELGELAQAQASHEQALAISQETGAANHQALSLGWLGILASDLGKQEQAVAYCEKALQLFRTLGDRRLEGETLNFLGLVQVFQEHYTQAHETLQAALAICEEVHDRQLLASYYRNLGIFYDRLGQYTTAREHLHIALKARQETGEKRYEGEVLIPLSLLALHENDFQAAYEYSLLAQEIFEGTGDVRLQGYALTNAGHALARLGKVESARTAYQAALEIRRKSGQSHLEVEVRAGLARLDLEEAQFSSICEHLEQILDPWQSQPLAGVDDPSQIWLTRLLVLQAIDDPRLSAVLTQARHTLMAQAAGLTDPTLRRSFLEDVAANRIILNWPVENLHPHTSRSQTVRLPRQDAPRGRPLLPEEFVEVTWTPSSITDEAMCDPQERRRKQILRLAIEATAQGAIPRDEDLAVALGISLATLRRDLLKLKSQGRPIVTRGRKMTT